MSKMSTEAEELHLFLENESSLYPKKKAIAKNMARKLMADAYSTPLAVKGWLYLVEDAAKQYAKDFSASPRDWSKIFSVADRKQVAVELEKEWFASAQEGDIWWE